MGKARKLAVIALLVLAGGCGGGESSNPIDTSADTGAHRSEPSHERHGDFRGANGGNSAASFGHEASGTEREQANRVVTAWMKARAVTDWAKECRYLSRHYRHALVVEDAMVVSEGEVENCPQALDFFGIAASGDYVNTLSGPIDSFRIASGQGVALYHGRDGNDWSVLMEKEDGKWWVVVAMPSELE